MVSFTVARRAALGLLASPFLAPARAEAAHRLSLLHMNDFHSRHEPISASSTACVEGRPCYGGAARLATAIRQGREAATAEGRAPLLLDAGDQFMGSLFYTRYRGEAEARVQALLRPAAMTTGNHEFDNGPETLARYVDRVSHPVLAANIDAGTEPALAGKLHAGITTMLGGMRVVVVGLATPETPGLSSPGPNLRFLDPAEAMDRAVFEARRQGPCVVVALSHLGLTNDRRLADDVQGIDVIIGGHSHTLLANGLAGAEGPYPVEQHGARIVQAGCHGRYLGRLDLDVAADGSIAATHGVMRELTSDIPQDPQVAALVAELAAPLEEWRRRPVGRLPGELPLARCRLEACELGGLAAEAVRRAVPNARIGWMNAGGMRAGLPGGTVTWGDVLTMLPFQNTVARMVLRGHVVKDALESGLSRLPDPDGRFPQLSGLRYRLVAEAPIGQRAQDVEVSEDGRWRPLEMERAYVVATNDFSRKGGDGYTMFRDQALEAYDAGPALEEAMVEQLGR
jgi:5'-nucleotidase/UDP-sugar diphosphatase